MSRVPIQFWFWLCLALLLACAYALYAPGLHGDFLFDDYANLPSLGAAGPIDNWPALLRFITSGTADPTGRPVALLSFLIDARDWPASPYLLKRTNLLLHLFNGALLSVLLRSLGRRWLSAADDHSRIPSVRTDLAALLGAAFWLLHPLFVSTTLYIVQREAILPATFALIGLIAWLKASDLIAGHRLVAGTMLAIFCTGGCILLGTLSKANGALLPLYIALLHGLDKSRTVPGQKSQALCMRMLLWTLAYLPGMALVSYLLWSGLGFYRHGIGDIRAWSIGERLLTEPRIVVDYLRLLWLPHPYTSGLFNDQYVVSTGWLSPPSTLPSLLLIAALAGTAWVVRRRYPAIAFALLFFFAAHLVESTTVPLELYYEHRNYVPALILFWPLALWICGVAQDRDQTRKAVSYKKLLPRFALALALLTTLGWMTHANARVWGDPNEQSLLWASLNPASPRAQASAAQTEMRLGRPDLAVTRLTPMLSSHPSQPQITLNLLSATCLEGQITPQALAAAETSMATMRDPGGLLIGWFSRMSMAAREHRCRGLDYATLESLIDSGMGNTRISKGRIQDLWHIRGELAIDQHRPNDALIAFNRALGSEWNIGTALAQAASLGEAGYPQLGLAHLEYYHRNATAKPAPGVGMPALHDWVLRHQQYWEGEEVHLRKLLDQDAHRTRS